MAVVALAPTPIRSRPGATLHTDRHNRSQWNSPELAWAAAGPMNAAGDGSLSPCRWQPRSRGPAPPAAAMVRPAVIASPSVPAASR